MSNRKDIDRRKFIELSVQGTIGVGLSTVPITTLNSCSGKYVKTIHGACYHDCPDRCSWKVTAGKNEIKEFQASTDNPYTAGKLCNKMVNFPNDVTFHPDRILTPLKRIGKKGEGKFEAISWETAISEVSYKLSSIISRQGGESVLPYSYGGNQGLVQGKSIPNRFFAHIGASQLERTICGNTAVAGIMATNGQTTGVLPEDIIHSRYIILWGTNPVLSNQHLWPFIQKARNDGAQLVVIDPFQSQTAIEVDWHIQPLPGTDTALALGMINVILAENLQDQDYIEQYTTGIHQLTDHVQKYSQEYVAKITGLEKETIVSLAREYAKGSPSLIRVLIGLEHQANGGSAFRSIAMLPAVTGAWRQLGGGLMHMTYELFGQALNWDKINLPTPIANPKTRSINMIQLGKALNDRTLDPPVEALFVFNSNPVVTTPNQNLIIKGLEREDLLMVVLEHFVTDTARYADYVFPATSVLENWDILTSWGTPYLNINQPAIEPVGEAKPNTEFFRLLSWEMGFTTSYLYEKDIDIVKSVLDSDHEFLKNITLF
jgi:anaerobic selenocysteine-containing dehydrogenase